MNPIRAAIVAFVVVGAVAACSSGGAVSTTRPTAATTAPAAPTVAPTATPVAVVASAASPSAVAVDPTISLYEYKVIAPATVKAGKSTFTITNYGTMPHEMLVFESALAPDKYPIDAAGDIVEDGHGVTLLSDGENIDPSGVQVRTIDLKPGTYLFVCNIPGHFKQGMFMVVTVAQ